LDTWGDSYTVR